MNKSINPALARIQAIKNKARPATHEFIEPFVNPIIQQTDAEQPQEELPPLEEDTNEERVAMRLVQMQAEGLGAIVPTRTDVYNHTEGTMDRLEAELKKMLPKSET